MRMSVSVLFGTWTTVMPVRPDFPLVQPTARRDRLHVDQIGGQPWLALPVELVNRDWRRNGWRTASGRHEMNKMNIPRNVQFLAGIVHSLQHDNPGS